MFGFRFINDRTLIQLIRMGNEEALTFLYARTWKPISRFVIKNKGRMKDAESLALDSLITAWQHVIRSRQTENLSLRPYIMAIARNKWNKRQRKKGRKQQVPENEPSAAQKLLAGEWSKLSEQDRKILGYFYFDGFNLKEIAEFTVMNSADSVRKRKSMLMMELYKKMQESDPPENFEA